ncbi:hypothetical protein HPG69_001864 [Diceros bicornis minor]|uniref:RNA polymerase-associated protein LEO1 n=1 Tax=Diceros bicornis minor TaxID=77932 RepID=A0A7J7FBZ9_DICBM|nr:hypothetical protein HPG69_001864 [Diceros bicornis minor]
MKRLVENTIRWRMRQDEEGNKIKESNARVVKWSDGSLSLHLGSEVFDVYKAPLQDNHSHLFVREDTGLQGQAVFKSKLTFRCSRTQIRILPIAGRDPECQRTEMIMFICFFTERRGTFEGFYSPGNSPSAGEAEPAGAECPLPGPSDEEEEEGDEALKTTTNGNSEVNPMSQVPLLSEEWARIYSSDNDEGSEKDKGQRLLRAKKLTSDEVKTTFIQF